MRLFMLLGGDPNLSKPNQLLRVPGSVNPKTEYGRKPTETKLHYANNDVGISDAPILRVDGSICNDQGYDEQSMMLLDFGGVTYPPIAAQAERQAACKTLGTSGRSSSRPGNSHRFGRASRQYVRRILRSCGESMT